MPDKDLVMYSRTTGCPYVSIAKRVLDEHNIAYREIFIDVDPAAKNRVLEWTGFLSVPTLVVAEPGDFLPYMAFSELERGASPRGIDRGPMLTEASTEQLKSWLVKHGFLAAEHAPENAS